jgi:hypothetical protein
VDLQDLGSLGEFVGAVAVVLSLVYLSAQIRQNTRSLRANAYKDFILSIASTREAIARDRDLAELWERGLSDYPTLDADRYRFDAIMARAVSNFQIAREFYSRGLLESSAFQSNRRILLGLLTSAGGSRWWSGAQDSYEPELRDELNQELSRSGS